MTNKDQKNLQGRRLKGFPEPLNMTASQIARGIMDVKPMNEQTAASDEKA